MSSGFSEGERHGRPRQQDDIVAGAGPGLGRETALASFRQGANVVIAARTAARLDTIAQEVDATGQRVATVVADITDEAGCRSILQTAVDRFGAVDGIVNVAVESSGGGGLQSAGDFSNWRETFEVNVFGTMPAHPVSRLTRLKKSKGAVVMVSRPDSYHAPPPAHIQVEYASSKAALTGAMRHLAAGGRARRDPGERGHAGLDARPPSRELRGEDRSGSAASTPDTVLAELTARMPLRRMASDGDVAEAHRLPGCLTGLERDHRPDPDGQRRRGHALSKRQPALTSRKGEPNMRISSPF